MALPPRSGLEWPTEAAVQAAVAEQFDGDAALYRSFANECEDQFKLDAAAGDRACASGDLIALRRLAHNLKAALRMLGHASASALASELEEQARVGNGMLAQRSWRELHSALSQWWQTGMALSPSRSPPSATSGLDVLFIEDYPPGAALVRDTLGRRHPEIRLDVVTTVAEAIERLERFEQGLPPRYAAVLTDLHLPDGQGLDILSRVRGRRLGLAVVILTAADELDTARDALRAGADAYVAKRDDYLAQLPAALRDAVHLRASVEGGDRGPCQK